MTRDAPINVPTDRYVAAVGLARDLHADQARKGTTIPYLSHLLGVSSLIMEHGGHEDLAIAGSVAGKKTAPFSSGTFPTTGAAFVILLLGTILIVGALTHLPALALGPIADHLLMLQNRIF